MVVAFGNPADRLTLLSLGLVGLLVAGPSSQSARVFEASLARRLATADPGFVPVYNAREAGDWRLSEILD